MCHCGAVVKELLERAVINRARLPATLLSVSLNSFYCFFTIFPFGLFSLFLLLTLLVMHLDQYVF